MKKKSRIKTAIIQFSMILILTCNTVGSYTLADVYPIKYFDINSFNEYESYRVYWKKNHIDVFITDTRETDLTFYLKKSDGTYFNSFEEIKKNIEEKDKELLFATNGGMFYQDYSPVGLYIEDWIKHQKINTNEGSGNFSLKPNGIFTMTDRELKIFETHTFSKLNENPRFATQSGPMLLLDGKIHHKFNKSSKNKFVRSGVGVVSKNIVAFAISEKPISFYDFALFFKDFLRCRNALYLDGRVSKMYLPQLGRNQLSGEFGPIIAVSK